MKKYIFIIFMLLYSSSFCFAQDVDLLWEARALKATENLIKLKEVLNKNPSKKLKHEIMLEFAYAAILTMPNLVKKTENSVFYYLVLSYGNDGLLLVAYIYDAKNFEFEGVRIESIPKNHSILMKDTLSSEFFGVHHNLESNEPMIVFSRKDPFAAKVF